MEVKLLKLSLSKYDFAPSGDKYSVAFIFSRIFINLVVLFSSIFNSLDNKNFGLRKNFLAKYFKIFILKSAK